MGFPSPIRATAPIWFLAQPNDQVNRPFIGAKSTLHLACPSVCECHMTGTTEVVSEESETSRMGSLHRIGDESSRADRP